MTGIDTADINELGEEIETPETKKPKKEALHLRKLTRQHWEDKDPFIFAKLYDLVSAMSLSDKEFGSYISLFKEYLKEKREQQWELEREKLQQKLAAYGKTAKDLEGK